MFLATSAQGTNEASRRSVVQQPTGDHPEAGNETTIFLYSASKPALKSISLESKMSVLSNTSETLG